MKTIRITTGTYNTADYRVIKEYTNQKSALKFLKSIGYVYDLLENNSWSNQGTQYKLSIN